MRAITRKAAMFDDFDDDFDTLPLRDRLGEQRRREGEG